MARVFLVGVDGMLIGAQPLLAALENEVLSFHVLHEQHREPHAWLLFDPDGARAIQRTRDLRAAAFGGAIAILSGSVSVDMVNAGYRAGADDWDIAPFSAETIGIRLRRILEQKFPQISDEVPIQMRTWREPLVVDGHSAKLTETEFKIFHYLYESRDRPVQEREIIREVLHTHHAEDSSVVRFHIMRLSAKLPRGLIWSEKGYILSLSRAVIERRRELSGVRKPRGSGKITRVRVTDAAKMVSKR